MVESKKSCLLCNNKSECFRQLSDSQLDFANSNRAEISYRKGEMIAKQGNFYTHILYLQSGMVKVYKELPDGSNLILSIFGVGSLIGLPFLFKNQILDYSVAALDDTTICAIDRHAFEKLIHENGEFAAEVVNQLNQCTLYNYDRLVSLTHKQINGRFADTLLYLSRVVYKANPFNLTLSRKDLAEYTGVSVMSVIRAIKEFKNDGIIDISGNRVEILNFSQLERISRTG
ncbi:Crp/Fnr family transcriptional regulator [Tenuifilum sp.]|uniref:Crp/Fnr family transcriptional regulator n=3 Tax=Tenuifilum sp. TaxID=2760880 RepID=UPI001B6921B5|nr:Crp/Fnr family transcriptional regulator [Bacteroidales bacterium]HOK60601.1 Crp/Fnr family transcriptional regulator [Tenuifilum sp.]MBP9029432.1 Crp/Fnr family transcriptional regulator [Bacteroidales bacterium]HOK84827.1 Crp/Fnr family transcriptional regulator [Tenuifilum sp.]HOU73202.1 Crp/Fnr family transcriptional regulator [Tenuifilum sp.]